MTQFTPPTPDSKWKKPFITIYIGQAFSILGSAAAQFAIIWWLTVKTESAITLTVAMIISFLPNIFIGPFAGVIVDRYNRRTIMILADGFVALSSAFLAVAFLLNPELPTLYIYLALFMRSLGGVFHGPAMQAAIPMLVPADKLMQAGGWGQMIQSLSSMLGPVLGAALMGFMPIYAIMLIDIVGAAFAVICLMFVHVPDLPRTAERPHLFADMKLGFVAIWENKPLRAMFVPIMILNLLFSPLGALFPLLVRVHYHGEAFHNSIVEFAFSGGMLVASAILGAWGGAKRRFLMMTIGMLVMGVTCAIGGLLPAEGFWIFCAGCFILGGSGTFGNVPAMAYIQETTAPEVMGKVMSLIMMSMTVAMPVSLLVAGPVSEVIGINNWFLWSGVGLLADTVLFRILTRKYDAVTMRPNNSEAGAQ
jgi:DHA3 family macrolide efflux protein-like MFS transporter